MENREQRPSHGLDTEPPTPLTPVTPRLETLLGQIRALHQACHVGAQELAQSQARRDELQQHLEQLEEHQEELEVLWQQQQEALRVARSRWQEVEAEGQRQRQLCVGRHRELEGAKKLREQMRDKRRRHRLDFWQQLEALMEEHKELQQHNSPWALAAALSHLQVTEQELLLHEATESQLGPEGHVTTVLLQREHCGARGHMGAAMGHRQTQQGRRDRLAEELGQLQQRGEVAP